MSALCNWPPPSAWPELAPGEVHLWCADLDAPRSELWPLLSADEQVRAERFLLESVRDRFVAGRGLLRRLLGRYLNLPPQTLQFGYDAGGKPHLPEAPQLCFNLAHSGGLALYALCLERRLGVDIEYLNPATRLDELVGTVFSAAEQATWLALPPPQQRAAFFAAWTRKEAYLKARGDGLRFPLGQFSVSLHPDEPARLLDVAGNPDEAARWRLYALQPAPGYAAALALAGPEAEIRMWRLD